MEKDADLEARAALSNPDAVREVNASLERIQGELRQYLNNYRYKANSPTPRRNSCRPIHPRRTPGTRSDRRRTTGTLRQNAMRNGVRGIENEEVEFTAHYHLQPKACAVFLAAYFFCICSGNSVIVNSPVLSSKPRRPPSFMRAITARVISSSQRALR